ncbi:MAG: iron-containing alcohol dehydrogenase [Treponema sp.]|nr:iron-containing alcohol dehydrogenase [Treponema sp.]
MNDFIFRINPNIVLGSYTVSRLGQQVMEWGNRFMVILDPILNEVKVAEKILQSLSDRKVEFFVFSELTEGGTSRTVQRVLNLAKESHIHGIIAVGGQKAMNIARAAAAFYNEAHDLYTFVDGANPTTQALPCICVPTTFRCPFVFTNEVPIVDSRSNELQVLKVQNSICKLVIIDPNLMLTLTENQRAIMSLEILSMGIESYLSQKANFFSDMFVEKGLEVLSYAMDGSPSLDITTPEEILLAEAGIMISMAASSSSLGLGSMLSLTINARYRLNKSLVSSILLPYALEDAAKFKSAKLEKLAHIMRVVPEDVKGEESSKAFIESVRQRIAKENLPARLKDLQVSIERLSLAVEDASRMNIMNTLPRSMSTDDVFDFVKQAY